MGKQALKQGYFKQQLQLGENYILPFLRQSMNISPGMRVLEIGCAQGGLLKVLAENECICTGIEPGKVRHKEAREHLADLVASKKVKLLNQGIMETKQTDFEQRFGLVIMKDVIEHLPNKVEALQVINSLLAPNGKVFIAFPPWRMPFGGHQQICDSSVLSKFLWLHLLPSSFYQKLLQLAGEPQNRIQELLSLKEMGLSIGGFEQIAKSTGFTILNKRSFLVRPIYQYKFGLKPRRQFEVIESVPFFADFLTSGVYYLSLIHI